MPSGPPELHEYWENQGRDGADFNAMAYLRKRGFKLTSRWSWIAPHRYWICSAKENMAINYLCWEWDFDGLEDKEDYDEWIRRRLVRTNSKA